MAGLAIGGEVSMILRQFLHTDLVAIYYIFGCGGQATAAVVDPAGGARILVLSVRRVHSLPDYLDVLPGAFSGSPCCRHLSGKHISTIGFEKRHNAALQIEDEVEFVRLMLADIPTPPREGAALR